VDRHRLRQAPSLFGGFKQVHTVDPGAAGRVATRRRAVRDASGAPLTTVLVRGGPRMADVWVHRCPHGQDPTHGAVLPRSPPGAVAPRASQRRLSRSLRSARGAGVGNWGRRTEGGAETSGKSCGASNARCWDSVSASAAAPRSRPANERAEDGGLSAEVRSPGFPEVSRSKVQERRP
jgi:hypothetical protein